MTQPGSDQDLRSLQSVYVRAAPSGLTILRLCDCSLLPPPGTVQHSHSLQGSRMNVARPASQGKGLIAQLKPLTVSF